MTLAFLEPGLVAIGDSRPVKTPIDAQLTAQSITSNNEMMDLVERHRAGNNAWAVGRFDVIASQAKLPDRDRQSDSPGEVVRGGWPHQRRRRRDAPRRSARRQAAENLRDVVRGFLALARMQAQNDPQAQRARRSRSQLTGTGKTVALSFTVPPRFCELMAPKAAVAQQH